MRYEMNETMKMLGDEPIVPMLSEEIRNQISDVLDAYGWHEDYRIAVDLFILGFIHGKKRTFKEYV